MERIVVTVRETRWVLLPLRISDPGDPNYPNSSYYPRDLLAVAGNVDNDGDGLVDEDGPADITADGMPGIIGIDDDDDGFIDEGGANKKQNDDEDSNIWNEDRIDGIDNDGDGLIDEDPGPKTYASNSDDDADGLQGEDPFDPLIYYLAGTALMERQDVLGVTIEDNVIAENVSEFRVVRRRVHGNTLIDIHIKLDNGKKTVALDTTVLALSRIDIR
jgi:hypothetical protein